MVLFLVNLSFCWSLFHNFGIGFGLRIFGIGFCLRILFGAFLFVVNLDGRLQTWRALEAYGFRMRGSKIEYLECNFSKR